jgi:uncharacterized membrane protein required for colicin V production
MNTWFLATAYPCTMSWIDLVIVVIVLIAGFRGESEGALRQLTRFVGVGAGFIVGTLVAPSISTDVTRAAWRPLLALGIVLVGVIVGSQIGRWVGSFAARSLRALKLGLIDRVAGVVVGVAGALVFCWLAAGLLGSTAWGSVAQGIQQSSILAVMNSFMPPVPSIEAKIQTLFRNENLPSVFASVIAPTLPAPYANPKSLGPLVRGLGSPSGVVKVIASGGCSSDSQGTAFFISTHDAITNAHVVAGHSRVMVNGAPAQVALFDPQHDVAVLRVPSLTEPVLRFLTRTPTRGTPVQVIGFPLNASRTGAPGTVEGELFGQGRDIYDQALLSKTVIAIEVNVQPGSSGSPVLVGPFVAGVVESKSVSQASTAYAIPDSVVQADVAKAPASGEVSTQSCLP